MVKINWNKHVYKTSSHIECAEEIICFQQLLFVIELPIKQSGPS